MPDRLVAALRTKQLLLVLDNCEHTIGAVAELAELLLRSAPGLRILATSREPLALSGELLWPVPPLELPHPADAEDPEGLQRFSAVQLFVQRVAAANPASAVDVGNAAAIAAICRRLDGLPLALELAAARVRALPLRSHWKGSPVPTRSPVSTPTPRCCWGPPPRPGTPSGPHYHPRNAPMSTGSPSRCGQRSAKAASPPRSSAARPWASTPARRPFRSVGALLTPPNVTVGCTRDRPPRRLGIADEVADQPGNVGVPLRG